MKRVTHAEKDWLLKNNYIKQKNGRYPYLVITGKGKKGKRKKYHVPEFIYDKLKYMQDHTEV